MSFVVSVLSASAPTSTDHTRCVFFQRPVGRRKGHTFSRGLSLVRPFTRFGVSVVENWVVLKDTCTCTIISVIPVSDTTRAELLVHLLDEKLLQFNVRDLQYALLSQLALNRARRRSLLQDFRLNAETFAHATSNPRVP